MKKLIFSALGLLVIAGCKEVGPNISVGTSFHVDTTYMLTAAPATDAHNVLVEEFTGQACENCPAARAELDTLAANNPPGRINVVGIFIPNFSQTVPPPGSKHDFRTDEGGEIASFYGGVDGLPAGGVDRVDYNGLLLQWIVWANEIDSRLNTPDSLNLEVASNYNAATTVATLTVTVTYTKALAYAQDINVAVVEDSIVDIQQESALTPPYLAFDSSYLFMDVFRGMVSTLPNGDPVNTPDKNPGRVYRRYYSYTLPVLPTSPYPNPPINPYHCRVIAFVTNNGTNGTVAQSAQAPLVGH